MDLGRFTALPPSPFFRLRQILAQSEAGGPEISLSLGEPSHPAPEFVLQALRDTHGYSSYPPITGLPEFRTAAHGWLQRRFKISNALINPDTQILPLNGTREGLFLAAQVAPQKDNGLVFIPNPFYQVYAAAAYASNAEPVYLRASIETNFLPDLDAISEAHYQRCQCFFLCSPANPQGAVAEKPYLTKLLAKARQYNFLILADECYSEIFDRSLEDNPPPSILECVSQTEMQEAPFIVFHSLSKRSNLPGLRSGFCTGGKDVMDAFLALRQIAGPQCPMPAQRAAALAWGDDEHVAANRRLYQQKLDIAETIFGNEFGFYRPAGGFFLWLNAGNGVEATKHLWSQFGIKVLPGAYLARDEIMADGTSYNPADAFIRVALVSPIEQIETILKKLYDGLTSYAAHSQATHEPAQITSKAQAAP